MVQQTEVRHFHRWLDLEQMLKDEHIEYEWHPDFPISDIDIEYTTKVNGRSVRLNREKVEQYAEVLRDGSMPGGVATSIGGRTVGLDLVHRVHGAKKARLTTMGLYIVKGDIAKLNDLATAINIRFNGLELTTTDRSAKLREEVEALLRESGKVSVEERHALAKKWQFSAELVRTMERANKSREMMLRAGVDRPEKYDDERTYHISRAGDSEAIKALAKFVDHTNPANDQLRKLSVTVRDEVSPEARLKIIEEAEKTVVPRETRRSRTRRKPDSNGGGTRAGQFDPARIPGLLGALAQATYGNNSDVTLAFLAAMPDSGAVLSNVSAVEVLLKRIQAKLV